MLSSKTGDFLSCYFTMSYDSFNNHGWKFHTVGAAVFEISLQLLIQVIHSATRICVFPSGMNVFPIFVSLLSDSKMKKAIMIHYYDFVVGSCVDRHTRNISFHLS